MITEHGSIKVQSAMDADMQKEFFKQPMRLALAFLIVGAIGFCAFLALEVVSIIMETGDEEVTAFLILFGVFMALGIALRIIFNTAIKNAAALPKINVYEFYSGYFTVDQTLNGESVLHNKILNIQITKSKETKKYLFFYVGTSAFPVLKSELTEAELNTIRGAFGLPVSGATVSLSAEPAQPANGDNNELS